MGAEQTMKDSRGNEVSLPEEQRQQVISYLKHQASKRADDLAVLVQRGATMLEQPLAGVTDAQAQFVPAAGEWSISEVLRHVEASAKSCAEAIAALARGQNSTQIFDAPSVSQDDSLTGLRRRVAAAYEQARRAVASLDEADLETTAHHPFFGELNCKEWAAFVYVHSRDHVNQIEQIKGHPQFPR